MEIFPFHDYKSYLSKVLKKGEKSKFSQFVGCSSSYLSQVLKGKPHLTLEQGALANRYLEHSREESLYFMLLLQEARSGSLELRRFFREQLQEMQQKRAAVSSRITTPHTISSEAKGIYYSSWVYPAVHMLLAVPELQDSRQIAKRLKIPHHRVEGALNLLREIGLIEMKAGRIQLTEQRTHLDTHSPLLVSYHMQSRMRALENIPRSHTNDLHYSAMICHTREDALRIRETLLDCVGRVEKIYRPSKEETVYGFNIDYFEL